jgi:hypothetical protein
MINIRIACGLVLGSLLLTGCAHRPETASTWERNVDRPLEYKNVLVVVFDSNITERIKLENEIAGELDDHFVIATPSADIGLNLRTERWSDFNSWVKNNNKQAVITIMPYRIDSLRLVDDYIVTETDMFGDIVTKEWSDWNSIVEYGIEVVVWDTSTWNPMWQARSGEITHIDRLEEVSEFVDYHAQKHGWWASR